MFKFTTEKKNKNGFYIVLFIIIGIMLSTGTLLMTKNSQKQIEKEIVSIPNIPKGTPVPVTTPPRAVSTPKPTSTPKTEAVAEIKPTTEASSTPQAQSKEFAPIYPVYGEILVGFSGNELVYSKTLDDWRAHTGIDIKSTILEQVKASFDGVVESITSDPLMGITIVIDHGNDFKTVYSNLSTAEMMTVGKKVKKGDVISGVGDTALIETGEEAHIHFEIIKNGVKVDPMKYLVK